MKQDPSLKFKYSKGLGDIVACFLHSKAIGWLTKIITKKDKPCNQCNKRREALNILFPFPFWKFFFKNEKEYLICIANDYKNAGFSVDIDFDRSVVSGSKLEIVEDKKIKKEKIEINPKNDGIENYKLVSSSDNNQGDLIVRLQIFKRK
jgi:hypothetical protein